MPFALVVAAILQPVSSPLPPWTQTAYASTLAQLPYTSSQLPTLPPYTSSQLPTLPPSGLHTGVTYAMDPKQFSESLPWNSVPQVSEDREQPSIQPILHVTPRQDEELVGVIVTICSGASYDPLFNEVPQLAGEGKRVATYSVSATSLPYIAAELSGDPDQVSCASCLQQNLTHLIRDISYVYLPWLR